MKTSDLIERLQKKYPMYRIMQQDVVKNGDVHMEAITIRNDSPIAPTIYLKPIFERSGDDLDKAVEIISNIIEQNQAPDIDISKITNKTFILERIRIGVQKESDENLVKRPVPDFEGIEQYLYFSENGPTSHDMWSVKLRPELMESAGISEELAWGLAEKHTFAATTIRSMSEIIAEMMGLDSDDVPDMAPCEMYVISNLERCKGASAILNRSLLERFAMQHGCKSLCVLPSSIHEAILVPLRNESYSIEEFDAMVKEVNETQVSPEERLVNRAYVLHFE